MTPYASKNGEFTIPGIPSVLLDALTKAQRNYEDAKRASREATESQQRAKDARVYLKRDIINTLTAAGTATSREKEYVEHPDWKANEEIYMQSGDRVGRAADDESIYRQRMLTLRAAIIPVTAFAYDAASAIDAALTNADGDPAHSADPSVAHE